MNYEKQNAKEWQLSNDVESPPNQDSDDSDQDLAVPNPVTGTHESYNTPARPVLKPNTHLGSAAGSSTTTLPRTIIPLKMVPFSRTPGLIRRYNGPPVRGKFSLNKANAPLGVRSRATLLYQRDNAAKASYRQRERATTFFTLDKPSSDIEPNQVKMHTALEEIGVRMDTYIRPPQSSADRNLLIWGTFAQASATITELKSWVRRCENILSSGNFKGPRGMPSVRHLTENQKRALDKQIQKEAARLKFRQTPSEGKSFQCTGAFLWPMDEVRPSDLLGPSYEALDPVRMFYQCYIIFDSQLSVFKILSNQIVSVTSALKRMEVIVREFVARSSRSITMHLVEPPSQEIIQKEIVLRDGRNYKLAELTGGNLTEQELAVLPDQNLKLAAENKTCMQHATLRSIAALRYYRGRIRMRVHLGTFALTVVRCPGGLPRMPRETFMEDLKMPSTEGKILKDLQMGNDAKTIVAQICKATDLFDPPDMHTSTLEKVTPVYTAKFDFRYQDKRSIRLEVEVGLTYGTKDDYEISRTQWTRLEEETVHGAQQPAPLNLYMIRLQGGITWKLQITADNALDRSRVTPEMSDFVSSIVFKKPPKDVNPAITGPKVFHYSASSMPLHRFEQKIALRYQLKAQTMYIFELARYDTFPPVSFTSKQALPVPATTEWSASFYNLDWDMALGENAALSIGEAAKWTPTIDGFFPKNHQSRTTNHPGRVRTAGINEGFDDFLQNTQRVVELLNNTKSTLALQQKQRECPSKAGEEEIGEGSPEVESTTL